MRGVVGTRRAPLPLALDGALLAIGIFLLVPLTAHTSIIYLLTTYAVFGVGAGLVAPPITNTAVSGLPPDQTGVGGALASSCRQFGIVAGIAITGSIVTGTGAGLVSSSHAAWAVLEGFGALALLLGVVSTGRWVRAAASQNGERVAGRPGTGWHPTSMVDEVRECIRDGERVVGPLVIAS